jgi:Pyridoxamine 5'-phosphate oxidase
MPTARPIEFPAAYGVKPGKMLDWEEVRTRLVDAPTYWLSTVRRDGRPHTVPLDGLWVDDVWWYGGDDETVHMRTVVENPNVVMHIPDPSDVVIVEGAVRTTETSEELAQRLADAADAKYGYGQEAEAYARPLGLHPTRVLAWSMLQKATRFDFD